MIHYGPVAIFASLTLASPTTAADSPSSVDTVLVQPGGEPSVLPFEILDWLVLAAYAVLMIAVGMYYVVQERVL